MTSGVILRPPGADSPASSEVTMAITSRSLGLSVALTAALAAWASDAHAQWPQWGQNPGHTSFLPAVQVQSPDQIGWQFQFDQNPPAGEILIHYAVPLVLDDGNLIVTLRHEIGPLNATYDVVKLDNLGNIIWGPVPSDYRYPSHNWEPVFQPVVANGSVYYPGAGGVLHTLSLSDGTPGPDIVSDAIPPDADPAQLAATVFVGGVPTVDGNGTIYYTIRTQGTPPPGVRHQVVKATTDGTVIHADFADLTGNPSHLTPLNAGAAIASDGSIWVVTTTSSSTLNRLLGLNPDLSLKCTGNLDQIPTKAARVISDSSSVPVVGPDGRVFYGGWNSNGLSRGYLYEFSSSCNFLGYYDFGWDDTPAIYQPDPSDPTTYFIAQKDNHYENGTHVGPYYITALNPNIDPNITDDLLKVMGVVWRFPLVRDGVASEWCINQPAVDMNGTVLANGEDGYYYAIAWGGQTSATQKLIDARDAAYTPLAIANDGTVYTLNSGVLFQIQAAPPPQPKR
jgi:hypothetical protein